MSGSDNGRGPSRAGDIRGRTRRDSARKVSKALPGEAENGKVTVEMAQRFFVTGFHRDVLSAASFHDASG